MEESIQPETSRGSVPGTLPPEVEAELKRRLSGETPVGAGVELQERHAPSLPPPAEPAPSARPGLQDRLKRLGPLGVGVAYLLGKLKYLTVVAKFAIPALKTGGTMLLSMVVYAQRFGWWFAVGFVLCILAHEMGHVYVAWRMGVPVTAPLFIPGFGALILQKREAKSAWDEALIGIGGPVAGTLAGLFCLLVYRITGSPLMLGVAGITFLINLFNLAPIFPLDGGWITGAVSPRLWLLGIVGMVAAVATGFLRNPLIILLVILSLPRLWRGLKTGDVTPVGGTPTTSHQRLIMGISYLALCGLLARLMAYTNVRF